MIRKKVGVVAHIENFGTILFQQLLHASLTGSVVKNMLTNLKDMLDEAPILPDFKNCLL
jgi:hypothetical protein